jgi:hypothetical protein
VLEFTLAMPFIIAVIMLLIGLGRVMVYRHHGQVVARYASFYQKITGNPPEQLELARAVSIPGDELWTVAPIAQNDSGGIVGALQRVLGFVESLPVIGSVFRNNFSTQTIQQDATLDVGALVPGASGSTMVGISALGDNLGTTKASFVIPSGTFTDCHCGTFVESFLGLIHLPFGLSPNVDNCQN